MRALAHLAPAVALAAIFSLFACRSGESAEAGVGGDRSGCGDPDSHSVLLADHSCVCEGGYDWCSEDLDDFSCCPDEAVTDTAGETDDTGAQAPELPCGEDQLESLTCVVDEDAPSPENSAVWACNGERWIEVSGYADFACESEGFQFGYGCLPGDPEPEFLCGYGPGTTCEEEANDLCVNVEIIDTCVWGRRTIDRCRRLCVELEVFGEGFVGGSCVSEGGETDTGESETDTGESGSDTGETGTDTDTGTDTGDTGADPDAGTGSEDGGSEDESGRCICRVP
ncbi:hypothetical protein G6O69_12870 [Pseudenhygromyxa sp. WMMC2535]|uniref:hypothetical protein n=1 Tax=Pseudenhygromyxa sp. WMMC2535 TaxID=2712867 RepID=UPI001551873D|nr:hypothetical protein [Pseudenhygromyxa sp. WMMC2535]NVB38725.1 hypothetical protein [Pseudenhygromyxa sp. WMMC2535]